MQLQGERCQITIDLTGHASVADVRVHHIRKIDRTGAPRQFQNVPLRRKHVHLVGKQVQFQTLDELQRIARLALQFEQVLHPLAGASLSRVEIAVARFVQPVPGDTVFRHGIHLAGTDLCLDGHAVHAH